MAKKSAEEARTNHIDTSRHLDNLMCRQALIMSTSQAGHVDVIDMSCGSSIACRRRMSARPEPVYRQVS